MCPRSIQQFAEMSCIHTTYRSLWGKYIIMWGIASNNFGKNIVQYLALNRNLEPCFISVSTTLVNTSELYLGNIVSYWGNTCRKMRLNRHIHLGSIILKQKVNQLRVLKGFTRSILHPFKSPRIRYQKH